MAWSSTAHPRVAAGTASGGQFKAASGGQAKSKKPKAATTKRAKKTRSSKSGTVTVKRGDTLSAIARRNGESLAQLKKDNPGLFTKAHRGGNLIFPGNKVKLRSATKVRSKSGRLKKAVRIKKG